MDEAMSSLRLDIESEPKEIDNLKQVAKIIRRPVTGAAISLKATMSTYPAPPPNSTYDRFGTLGRKWTFRIKILTKRVTATVGNNTVYGPWVVSSEKINTVGPQAKIHKGRWTTIQDEIDKITPILEKQLQAVIDRILAG